MYKKKKLLLSTLQGETNSIPPIWLMRQAGRYLAEYRKVRAEAGDFLSLCYNPKLAEEVTLQPIRRYGFDAAILFADILLIPDAMNRNVHFKTGEGPRMRPLLPEDVGGLVIDEETINKHLNPIYETVDRLSASLPKNVALIGFAGAPWTVATYMIAGKGTPAQEPARKWVYQHPKKLKKLINTLTQATIIYLRQQILAGAEVIKIFDSWAGSVPATYFDAYCVQPVTTITNALKTEFPDVHVIIFAKGSATHLSKFTICNNISALAVGPETDMAWAVKNIQPHKVIQGNVDPLALEIGGPELEKSVNKCLDIVKGGKTGYIFNLGHGIRQHTPPAHVEKLVHLIRNRL